MDYNSKLGIGTVQFGIPYGISNYRGKTPLKEVRRILDLVLNAGIDTLDTASEYGDAESILGQYKVDKFKVVSKFMPPEVDTITSQLYKSLSRLKIKKIYGFLAHRPLNLYNNPSQWEELNNLKSSGVINKIGFSLNETSELDKLLDIGIIPDLIQAPFNYFDRRFNKQMAELKAKGCEIHARSVFLQGLFFANTNNLSSYFYEVTSIIRALQDSTPFLSGSLLKFVIEQPFIDKVIIGVENPNQLLMNLEFMDKSSTLPELFTHIPERILVPSKWPQ